MPNLLTTSEIAVRLGCARRTVQGLLARKGFSKRGRDWLISPAELVKLRAAILPVGRPKKVKVEKGDDS